MLSKQLGCALQHRLHLKPRHPYQQKTRSCRHLDSVADQSSVHTVSAMVFNCKRRNSPELVQALVCLLVGHFLCTVK